MSGNLTLIIQEAVVFKPCMTREGQITTVIFKRKLIRRESRSTPKSHSPQLDGRYQGELIISVKIGSLIQGSKSLARIIYIDRSQYKFEYHITHSSIVIGQLKSCEPRIWTLVNTAHASLSEIGLTRLGSCIESLPKRPIPCS